MRFPWSPLPKFCRECGCPMERGEDEWKARFDQRTGLASRKVDDYWWCPRFSKNINMAHEGGHSSIHVGTHRVPAPDVEPCK